MSEQHGWPMVRLGDYIEKTSRNKGEDDIPVFSVTKHSGFVTGYFNKNVHSKDQRKYKIVDKGEFAYATIHLDEGSIGIAPELSAVSPMYTTFRISSEKVDAVFLLRYLKSQQALSQYALLGTGSVERRKNINFDTFSRLSIPLPPLEEQQRIAGILDHVENLKNKALTAQQNLETARKNAINDSLKNQSSAHQPLSDWADIRSGITKGRKVSGDAPLSSIPYLAVSNVKDGYLDLREVKTIDVTPHEQEKFSLRHGDILLTEGGDPDKLGRGTVWRDEIADCMHQNHVFRVRLHENSPFTPQVLMAVFSSDTLRSYFFRSAKQTTGIASINRTQLAAAPIPTLSADYISDLDLILTKFEHLRNSVSTRIQGLSELHHSLQTRAFQGLL